MSRTKGHSLLLKSSFSLKNPINGLCRIPSEDQTTVGVSLVHTPLSTLRQKLSGRALIGLALSLANSFRKKWKKNWSAVSKQ